MNYLRNSWTIFGSILRTYRGIVDHPRELSIDWPADYSLHGSMQLHQRLFDCPQRHFAPSRLYVYICNDVLLTFYVGFIANNCFLTLHLSFKVRDTHAYHLLKKKKKKKKRSFSNRNNLQCVAMAINGPHSLKALEAVKVVHNA